MTATDFVGHSCCTGSNIWLEDLGIDAVFIIFTETQTTNQTFTMWTQFSKLKTQNHVVDLKLPIKKQDFLARDQFMFIM